MFNLCLNHFYIYILTFYSAVRHSCDGVSHGRGSVAGAPSNAMPCRSWDGQYCIGIP